MLFENSERPLEKNNYMFLYYVLIFWPILRLCVINEVLISPEYGKVRTLVRCLENEAGGANFLIIEPEII